MDNKIELYKENARYSAEKYSVRCEIHPSDFIFDFLINNQSFPDRASAVNYYFSDADNSARKLKSFLDSICGFQGKLVSLLEFASGYGCVTRHLAKILPNTHVTSCDIHNEAVTFINETLDVKAIVSNTIPELFRTPEKYNAVFALSFFSHMPDITWGRWLAALSDKCICGGYLIFTTHGLQSMRCFVDPVLDERGYWFNASSEQHDLDTKDYGQTIVTRDYVEKRVSACPELELVYYEEAGWWGHQDLYIVKKNK